MTTTATTPGINRTQAKRIDALGFTTPDLTKAINEAAAFTRGASVLTSAQVRDMVNASIAKAEGRHA